MPGSLRHPSGGFIPLSTTRSSDDHVVNIPLTPVKSNISTGARKEGQIMNDVEDVQPTAIHQDTGLDTLEQRRYGRRRLNGPGNKNGERKLTGMGRFWETLLNFSIVTRYIIYIVPLSAFLTIPTLIGAFGPGKGTKIGGVRMVWFFLWIQIVWISLWVSKLIAKALPQLFQIVVGVVSSGVRKYANVIAALELPLSLVGWALTSLTTFTPVMTRNPDKLRSGQTSLAPWMRRMNSILGACLVSAFIYLVEKVFIQLVSVNYHRRQFEQRVKENKQHVKLLSQLYQISRKMFPDYTEFAEEDCIIHQGIAGSLLTPGQKNGTATPMRQFVGNLNVVGNKVTSVVGNVAREVTGKNVFNPNSAYSIVLDALQRKDSAEALAKRIWMSFVAENNDTLTIDDLLEVMGADNSTLAHECFTVLDRDGNGDVSLDEMIQGVLFIQSERHGISKSMQDVDSAIGVLDSVLGTIVFILVVFVFMAFNFSNFSTTLAAAGTVLISLSFIFALSAQEVLGSCIFLFVKHPYDVGDRVDVNDMRFVVEHISLLYTVFRRCDNGKTSQAPNNILNNQWIENISRSKDMQEVIKICVDYGTSFGDIQAFKGEMLNFVKENARDYRPDFDVEITGVNNLDKLELSLQIMHKGNWANTDVTTQRRNKFICAMILALKKIPIYGPGGGDPSVGEQGKPMYTVAISDATAQRNMQKAGEDKLKMRWDYHGSEGSDNEEVNDHGASPLDNACTSAYEKTEKSGLQLNTQIGATGVSTFDISQSNSHRQLDVSRRRSTRSSHSTDSRRQDVEQMRNILARASTRGRRKVEPAGIPPISPQDPVVLQNCSAAASQTARNSNPFVQSIQKSGQHDTYTIPERYSPVPSQYQPQKSADAPGEVHAPPPPNLPANPVPKKQQ